MKNIVFTMLSRAGLPSEQIFFLTSLVDKLGEDGQKKLDDLLDYYFANPSVEVEEFSSSLAEIAKKANAHEMSVEDIFLALGFGRIEKEYEKRGISREIFDNTVIDLRFKTEECIKRFGVVGNGSFFWYDGFLRLERFGLGRMQFEVIPFSGEESYTSHGVTIKPGDPVINMHIPSSGKFDEQTRIAAYKMAYDFYASYRKNDYLPIYAESWLLYSGNLEFYPEKSNLREFYNYFDIFRQEEDKNNKDAWRVFGCDATNLTYLPKDTSLQRNLIEYLKKGKTLGEGFGICLFDGKNMIRK